MIPLKVPRPFGEIVKRISGGKTPQLVATPTGLRSSRWAIDWDKVQRIYIGTMPGMGGRSLRLEPVGPGDLRYQPSGGFIRFLRFIDKAFGQPPVQFSERAFDRPLEDVIETLSRVAGRRLDE